MQDHPLDRPVWAALNGPQRALAVPRDAPAMRIDPDYGPFAAALPGHAAALAALLEGSDDEIWLVETAQASPPPGTAVRKVALLTQMVVQSAGMTCLTAVVLGEADVPAMTALAESNRPGPWRPSTWRYGPFFGIFRDGRLVAMAGERLRPGDGWAELSGVCTDPAHRGQGLAAQLIAHVVAGHQARGATTLLHSYADNHAANALYRRLGFVHRRDMVATILGQARTADD